jgi:hypothetical protein
VVAEKCFGCPFIGDQFVNKPTKTFFGCYTIGNRKWALVTM